MFLTQKAENNRLISLKILKCRLATEESPTQGSNSAPPPGKHTQKPFCAAPARLTRTGLALLCCTNSHPGQRAVQDWDLERACPPSQLTCRRETHTGPSNPLTEGRYHLGLGKKPPKRRGLGGRPQSSRRPENGLCSPQPQRRAPHMWSSKQKTQNGAVSAVGPSSPH